MRLKRLFGRRERETVRRLGTIGMLLSITRPDPRPRVRWKVSQPGLSAWNVLRLDNYRDVVLVGVYPTWRNAWDALQIDRMEFMEAHPDATETDPAQILPPGMWS